MADADWCGGFVRDAALRGVLRHIHGAMCLLHGSVQTLLTQQARARRVAPASFLGVFDDVLACISARPRPQCGEARAAPTRGTCRRRAPRRRVCAPLWQQGLETAMRHLGDVLAHFGTALATGAPHLLDPGNPLGLEDGVPYFALSRATFTGGRPCASPGLL